MNINDLNDVLVKYIEDNKIKHDIDYTETINCIKELIMEIEQEYNGIASMVFTKKGDVLDEYN